MAEENSSSSTVISADASQNQGSSQMDHPGMSITTVKLNYLEWSQSARMFIGSRKKLGYINGKTEEPSEDDPSFEKWESENLTVMS
jgi:hypothetical protein